MKLSGRIIWVVFVALMITGCNQTQQTKLAPSETVNAQIAGWRSESAGLDQRAQAVYMANKVADLLPNQRLNKCKRLRMPAPLVAGY